MSWRKIGKKEFKDSVRSRTLWLITGIFLLGILGSFLIFRTHEEASLISLELTASLSSILIPIIALMNSYLAIVGERESGSIKMLLGFPTTRLDVVLGKLVGRYLTVAFGVTLAFLIGYTIISLIHGVLPVYEFLAIMLLTNLLAGAFVGLAVGISSAVNTKNQAMILGIGFYLWLVILWNTFSTIVHYLIEGDWPSLPYPDWYSLLQELSPTSAYDILVSRILEDSAQGIESVSYLSSYSLTIVILVWAIVPVIAGYFRFRKFDL